MTTIEHAVSMAPMRRARLPWTRPGARLGAPFVPTTSVVQAKARLAPAPEITPLSERIVALQTVRLAMAFAVALCSLLASSTVTLGAMRAGSLWLPYVAAVGSAEFARRRQWRIAGRALSALLLGDAVFIAGVMLVSGQPGGVLSVLAYVDLMAVTLLLSYRTGLRLAVWLSLLQIGIYEYDHLVRGTSDRATEAMLRVLSFLLVAAGVALFSRLNERELRVGRDEMQGIAAMAAELEQSGSPDEARAVLVRHVLDLGHFERAVVLPADTADALSVACHARREPLLRKAIDASTDPALAAALPAATNVAVLPLSADGSDVGTLAVEVGGKPGAAIATRTLTIAGQLAGYAAMAIRNANLLEEVERLANTDALTGLANRRVFEEMLARELLVSSRTGSPLSLVVIDVDFFKKVNDVHGHQAGDEVLRHVGRCLATAGRATDIPARFGGEEFVVVLPACPPDEAVQVAERYRAAIGGPGSPVAVTASAGVATAPLNAADGEALLGAADAALYDAKQAGRDRTVVSRRRPKVNGRRTPLAAVRQ